MKIKKGMIIVPVFCLLLGSSAWASSPLEVLSDGTVVFHSPGSKIEVSAEGQVSINGQHEADCSGGIVKTRNHIGDRIKCVGNIIKVHDRFGNKLKIAGGSIKATSANGVDYKLVSGGITQVEINSPGVIIGSSVRVIAPGVRVEPTGEVIAPGVHISPSERVVAPGVVIDGLGSIFIEKKTSRYDGSWRERVNAQYPEITISESIAKLNVKETDKVLSVGLSDDVLFDFGSSNIRPEAEETLARISQIVRKKLEGKLRIDGHTDSIGSKDYNLKLSVARATAVMKWFRDREDIPADMMVGHGYGEDRAIASNTSPDGSDNPAGRQKNRRVEITIEKQRS